MALSETRIHALGDELFAALRSRSVIEPLTNREADITIEDAYNISLRFLERRKAEGERIVGKKIGVTVAGNPIITADEGGTTMWRFSGRADELDASVGEDGVFADVDSGKRQGELTATLLVDIATGTTIAEGDTLTTVLLYYDVIDGGAAVTIPLLKVLSVERGGEVRGRIEFHITGKTRGAGYTYAL